MWCVVEIEAWHTASAQSKGRPIATQRRSCVTIPDYQSLMLPVLSAASKGEIKIGQLVDQLAGQLGLTPDEAAVLLPSGKQTVFRNRVHWAKFNLSKSGLVETTRRGHFRITPRGEQVLQHPPARIDTAFLDQFDEFRQFREKSIERTPETDRPTAWPTLTKRAGTPDEVMREAHRQIDAALAQELLDRIQAAAPEFFERLVINLLLSMGFGGSVADAGRALGRSGDDGVDGVIDQDALGLDRVYVQAKRCSGQQHRSRGDPGLLRQPRPSQGDQGSFRDDLDLLSGCEGHG